MSQRQAALEFSQEVAVIVVNYNGQQYLNRCLGAIYSAKHIPAQVIVVDNASTDESVVQLKSTFPQATLLQQSGNLGFAAANNVAAEYAKSAKWLALINPDAFVEPDWLDTLSAHIQTHPEQAFVSCQLLAEHSPGVIDGAGDCYHVSGLIWRRLHGVCGSASSDLPFFAPCAAAALYRRDAFKAVGGFDERYFCYSEDIDLGFRLRLAGYQGAHNEQARVRHVGSGITLKESDFSIYYGHRNLVWTFVKNMPTRLFWRYLPQHLLMNLISVGYYLLRGRPIILKAKWDALKSLPEMVQSRQKPSVSVGDETLLSHMARGWLTPYLGRTK